MIYELRTYWAAPGKTEALFDRFRNLTLGLFERHQIEVIGFWTPDPATEESGTLIYLLRFESSEAKRQAWAAFQHDPVWQAGKAATEVNGKLASKIISLELQPTDFSPLK